MIKPLLFMLAFSLPCATGFAAPSSSGTASKVTPYFGCQVWVEPTDSKERVDDLFAKLAACGYRSARIFLMWPWIEKQPGQWDFRVFDHCFDAAAREGIGIKATLTANSGPWHIGTPGVLHSTTGFLGEEQRPAMERYIRACVERYQKHPALAQWILWNEPSMGAERTPETLKLWRNWLSKRYEGNLEKLNQRWRTGYQSFDEIPFLEQIAHPVHRGSFWMSYGPQLDDDRFRAFWLCEELRWIRDLVRSIDAKTETCVNPPYPVQNYAITGIDFASMGGIVDVVGASMHPAWFFEWTPPENDPGLVAVLTRHLTQFSEIKKAEITEMQSGGSITAGFRPPCSTPSEFARLYLAGIGSGASSVTGWCFNTRSHDFESGEWALLDDRDQIGTRARMIQHLSQSLTALTNHAGAFETKKPDCFVVVDPCSQSIEAAEIRSMSEMPGRRKQDGIQSAALIASCALEWGYNSTLIRPNQIPESGKGKTLVVTHLTAWDEALGNPLLRFAESGGLVVWDAASGRKNLDATLYRPWPGGGSFAGKIGLQIASLTSTPESLSIIQGRRVAGKMVLGRAEVDLQENQGWSSWADWRFATDHGALVYERPWGKGKLRIVLGMLGPSLIVDKDLHELLRDLIQRDSPNPIPKARVVGGTDRVILLTQNSQKGEIYFVIGKDRPTRGGTLWHVRLPEGNYHDFWSGEDLKVGSTGEAVLRAEDGIAIIAPSH